jgi:hypothetical protein
MSITEANLKAYIEQEWNENNAAKHGEVTVTQTLLNHCNKLLVRRMGIDPSWMGGVKQMTEIYEARSSHPTKEAGINELIRILMLYPNKMTAGVGETFEVTNPFAGGSLTTEQHYAGAKSLKYNSTVIGWTFTADAVVSVANYIALAAYIAITTDNGSQAVYLCPSGTTNYFATIARNTGEAYWKLNGTTNVSSFVAGNWYLFEFKNIDYTAKTFNLSVNGVHVGNYAFYPGSTAAGTASLAILNNTANSTLYIDAFQAGAATPLNRNTINVSKPEYLGKDGAGNHVYSLMFVVTRWE